MSISKEAQQLLNTNPTLDDLHRVGQYEAKVVLKVAKIVAERGHCAETYEAEWKYGNALEDTIEAAQELRRREESMESDDQKRQNRILGIE